MKIKVLDGGKLPIYKREGDSAMDCFSRTNAEWEYEDGIKVAYIYLGIKVHVPHGYGILLMSRSGHGWDDNITLANSVGLIDSNYRGELKAKLIKQSISLDNPPDIQIGDRVCQMALVEMPRIYWKQVDSLEDTGRGSNGLGSTGTK